MNSNALSNEDFKFSKMQDNIFEEGGALNQYGVDYNFEGKKIYSKGGSIYQVPGFSLNYLLKNNLLESPNYIKLDVDGIEPLILEGATFLKDSSEIKEIFVEINDNFFAQKENVLNLMKSYNFIFKKKFDNQSTHHLFNNTFNYLFVRKHNNEIN